MKRKLYMITGVHPTDAYHNDDLVGVVVRGNFKEWELDPGWFYGTDILIGDVIKSHDPSIRTSLFMVKVKPLQ